MTRDILTLLANKPQSKEVLGCALNLLCSNYYQPLKDWCSRITDTNSDPAFELLRQLIIEDKTRILTNLTNCFLKRKKHVLFIADPTFEGHPLVCEMPPISRKNMSSHDIANYIYWRNEYEYEYSPSYTPDVYNNDLYCWARWLKGDCTTENDTIMNDTFTNRFWNECYYTRDLLRGIALYAHAYMFYHHGWVNEEEGYDEVGTSVVDGYLEPNFPNQSELASESDFAEPFTSKQQRGSKIFNCIPRVHHTMWETYDMEMEDMRTLRSPFNPIETSRFNLPLVSFADDGIAIASWYNGEKVGYFLIYPQEYEDGADLVWSLMD